MGFSTITEPVASEPGKVRTRQRSCWLRVNGEAQLKAAVLLALPPMIERAAYRIDALAARIAASRSNCSRGSLNM